MAKRHLDSFDLEAEAQAKAISKARSLGSTPTHKGKRTLGCKMGYRKQVPPTEHNRNRLCGVSRRRSA